MLTRPILNRIHNQNRKVLRIAQLTLVVCVKLSPVTIPQKFSQIQQRSNSKTRLKLTRFLLKIIERDTHNIVI